MTDPICKAGLFCKVARRHCSLVILQILMIFATFNKVLGLCKIQALSVLKKAKTVHEGKIRFIDRYW